MTYMMHITTIAIILTLLFALTVCFTATLDFISLELLLYYIFHMLTVRHTYINAL